MILFPVKGIHLGRRQASPVHPWRGDDVRYLIATHSPTSHCDGLAHVASPCVLLEGAALSGLRAGGGAWPPPGGASSAAEVYCPALAISEELCFLRNHVMSFAWSVCDNKCDSLASVFSLRSVFSSFRRVGRRVLLPGNPLRSQHYVWKERQCSYGNNSKSNCAFYF